MVPIVTVTMTVAMEAVAVTSTPHVTAIAMTATVARGVVEAMAAGTTVLRVVRLRSRQATVRATLVPLVRRRLRAVATSAATTTKLEPR
jgi:hypothetical protein